MKRCRSKSSCTTASAWSTTSKTVWPRRCNSLKTKSTRTPLTWSTASRRPRSRRRRDLEATFGSKQIQVLVADKDVQKMTKKMSQTIEFTERWWVLQPNGDTDLQAIVGRSFAGFLGINAETQFFSGLSDIEIPTSIIRRYFKNTRLVYCTC